MSAGRCDTILVGAGSAGCVLANRLSADGSHEVLLLEAGPPDRKQEIHIPAAFSKLFRTELDWAYETEPQSELDGRRLYWPRGRVLGGSSSLNAMIYIRGDRSIYDGWAALGNAGWDWESVLPCFKRSERYYLGATAEHGGSGALSVARLRDPNPATLALVEAAVAAGHPRNDDFNAAGQEGFGLYHVTQKRGKRHSAARAFLAPALGRSNLSVVTGALVLRILFEGTRAVGVEFASGSGVERVEADRIVLCGGAINSPQLLMLSGVGPPDELRALDIEVVAPLPGVGSNLQDHLMYVVGCECLQPVSLASAESLLNLARFLLFRTGPLTSNVGEAGGFVRTSDASPVPDLQFHFAPSWFVGHGLENPEGHGISAGPTLLCPRSRGSLRLASADPRDPPLIDPRYLTERADLETLVTGVRMAREILAQEPLREFVGRERTPGAGVTADAEIEGALRAEVETLYHPVGTCRMGSDEMAVVDAALRVHGVEGLSVVDASVMPTIPNGNTNAPTMMVAERAAELFSRPRM